MFISTVLVHIVFTTKMYLFLVFSTNWLSVDVFMLFSNKECIWKGCVKNILASTVQWKLVMLKSEEKDELEDTKGES
jgi:K+ transporter